MKGRKLTRRELFKLGGQGAVALALGGALGVGGAGIGRKFLGVADAATTDVHLRLGATDFYVNGAPTILTPDGKKHYGFGFTPVPLSLTGTALKKKLANLKGRAQFPAPLIDITQGNHVYLTLYNLGLVARPDLFDGHTMHFHGFPNAIPVFDGVPQQSFSVPVNRSFTYFYNLREPGTYPYHCHFEDVEHIQMGMVGSIIVRPAANPKWAYDDPSTAFDREYVMFIEEMDADFHRNLLTVQESQTIWTDYAPDYMMLNGRGYPDTLKPNNDPSLPRQPVSSLVRANSGERVLLRMVNLGYKEHAFELPGIPMRVVGQDAKLLKGRDGTDLSYTKSVINASPGTTFDAIFTAPQVGQQTTYPLVGRDLANQMTNVMTNGKRNGGGTLTEVRVFPSGTLPAQSGPNQ